ncbi:hypothetical protein DDU33_07795 [Actinobacillus porcitonsillarum]|uniref:Uncharacterized protein n=1 Tax=Actinobacillus porcitonsillarum TaxID=189834 RepID=A0A2U8FKD2_9PAST|nr:hypothetical protein [Actinobacillus porcitonsillarum]AWI51393.1 hypothetical protein DDU33_07795 [Actinobacillus porcitonsillarum]
MALIHINQYQIQKIDNRYQLSEKGVVIFDTANLDRALNKLFDVWKKENKEMLCDITKKADLKITITSR